MLECFVFLVFVRIRETALAHTPPSPVAVLQCGLADAIADSSAHFRRISSFLSIGYVSVLTTPAPTTSIAATVMVPEVTAAAMEEGISLPSTAPTTAEDKVLSESTSMATDVSSVSIGSTVETFVAVVTTCFCLRVIELAELLARCCCCCGGVGELLLLLLMLLVGLIGKTC